MFFYSNFPKEERLMLEICIANNNAPLVIKEKAFWSCGTYTPDAIGVYRPQQHLMPVSITNTISDFWAMRKGITNNE
jgi:hypothetical protein